MDYRERITSNHKIMLGKPVIKGTRITVEILLKKMAEGASINDIIKMYPGLTKEDVFAALNYASDTIANEEIIAVS